MHPDETVHIDENARRRFEAAWRAGRPEPIEVCLPSPADPCHQATLTELIVIEMEFQWKHHVGASGDSSGVRPPALVEHYLQRFPQLNTPTTALELLRQEYQARQRYGDRPSIEEYRNRFPTLVVTGRELTSTVTGGEDTSAGAAARLLRGDGVRVPPPAVPLRQLPDRYRIEGELGRGGMGAILKGRDLEMRRDIAIKVMLAGDGEDAELRRRFVEEARIGGQLQHPGLVPVYDLGHSGPKQPFFTMKLVQGQTLDHLLKNRASPGATAVTAKSQGSGTGAIEPSPAVDSTPGADLPRFLSIFEQVCQTIAYVHAQRIIHRDLKPANIMVGEFGEVQVMDWGLAKVLHADASARGESRRQAVAEAALDPRPVSPAPPGEVRRDTEPGSVLGTPAYIAPEQACGEVDRLDERCDVFGLGAILCEILTGRPPYPGTTLKAVLQQAIRGDVEEARSRLDRCGASRELTVLARNCLEPQRERRPRQAGEVAAAVATYRESVQQRLRQAEMERAQAEIQAAEANKRQRLERQKRRMVVVAAAALLLLLTGIGAAALWYQQEQAQHEADELTHKMELAERKEELARSEAAHEIEAAREQAERSAQKMYLEKEIEGSLTEAESFREVIHKNLSHPNLVAILLSNLDHWQKPLDGAHKAWERAAKLAGVSNVALAAALTGRLKHLGQQLELDRKDFELAMALDRVRLLGAKQVDGEWGPGIVARGYPPLFAKLHLDPLTGKTNELAEQIVQLRIRYVIAAALDDWARALSPRSKWFVPLMELAQAADPDPWRQQVRDPKAWQEVKKLRDLAATVQPKKQTPQSLVLLAFALLKSGEQLEASALLRKSLLHHPNDFWLHFHLGSFIKEPVERAACFRAALAIRPTSSLAFSNLGVALKESLDLDGALHCFQEATIIDPKLAEAQSNLGATLLLKGNLEGGIAAFRTALEIDPDLVEANINLGIALASKRDLTGAAELFQKALQIEPNNPVANGALGNTLLEQGKFAAAKLATAKALQLTNPNLPQFFLIKNQLDKCEQLLARDQRLSDILAGKAKTKDAAEQIELAEMCLYYKKQYALALRFYGDAFAAEPKLAVLPHDYDAACAALQTAAGKDKDAADLTASKKSALRQQALGWLRSALASLMHQHQTDSNAAGLVRAQLEHWQQDSDLASVREEKDLAELPEPERTAWQELWGKVNKSLKQLPK